MPRNPLQLIQRVGSAGQIADAGMGHLKRNGGATKEGETALWLRHGLPEMTDEDRDAGEARSRKMVMFAPFALTLLGLCIAVPLHVFTAPTSLAKMLNLCKNYDLEYIALATVIIVKVVVWQNIYPMIYKARIMKGNSGNLRANMSIYRVVGSEIESGGVSSHVVLDDEGDVGMYNRANRSLAHLTENLVAFVLPMLLSGLFYPKHALVLTGVWAAGRYLHATGYTTKYGSHGLGFGLSTLATVTAEGLLTNIALLCFASKLGLNPEN